MTNALGAILAGLLLLVGILNDKGFFNSGNSDPAGRIPFFKQTAAEINAGKKQNKPEIKVNDLFSSLSGDLRAEERGTGKEEQAAEPKKTEESVHANKLPVEDEVKNEVSPTEKAALQTLKTVNYLPVRNWNVPFTEISAKSVLSTDDKAEKVFYQKNSSERLPIASLTKLTTALVVLDNYNLEEKIKISKTAVQVEGEMGGLVVGEILTVRNLLYVMLIESSNDAAFALAEKIGADKFVELMNKKAVALDLKNTHFANPAGFDEKNNYSTAFDLARLASAALNYSLIWEILQIKEIEIKSEADAANSNQQVFPHRLTNSNKLLGVVQGIVGGKTGYTELAGGCMILVVQFENFKVINIILGADGGAPFLDRFKETEKLINWLKEAYLWKL